MKNARIFPKFFLWKSRIFPLLFRKNYGKLVTCVEYARKMTREQSWRFLKMSGPFLAVVVLQVLCGLFLIAVVLIQSGKSAGLSGSIGGVADSFLSKNKAKSTDARMARATKWVGAAFVILTLALNILQ